MSRVWPRVQRVLYPVAGFGVGWASFAIADERGWLDVRVRRWLYCHNLKLQLQMQRLLPRAWCDAYGVPEATLRDAIARLERADGDGNDDAATGAAADTRMSFEQILAECSVTDQLHFLEEHALEEIPYFYIADLFHAWANLHGVDGNARAGDAHAATTTTASRVSSSSSKGSESYDAPVLCEALWRKLLSDVVPYDVSIRALCILATHSRRNAAHLAKLIDVAQLLDKYAAYRDKYAPLRDASMTTTATTTQDSRNDDNRSSSSGNDDDGVVPAAVVTAATLTLLRALNDAQVWQQQQRSHVTRLLLSPLCALGMRGVDAVPLARRVSATQWCTAFAPPTPTMTTTAATNTIETTNTTSDDVCVLPADVRACVADAVVPFVHAMHVKLRCAARDDTTHIPSSSSSATTSASPP